MVIFSLKVELAFSHREIEIKVNEMTSFRNTTDCINLVKFCDDLNDLSNLRSLVFGKDEDMSEQEIETNQIIQVKNDTKTSKPISDYLVLLIKHDSLSTNLSSSMQEAVRSEIKKNYFLSQIWNITIIYVSHQSCSKLSSIKLANHKASFPI